MKRAILRAVTSIILVIVFGPVWLSLTTARQPSSAKTGSLSEKTGMRPEVGSLSPAIAVVNRKIVPEQLWGPHTAKSAPLYRLEKVEVLARSVTFPSVLNQGELAISVEFPNPTILCLDAAYYAGRVQGLIWAMDRNTVVEHKLYWTIDAASDLLNSCLKIFLPEALSNQTTVDEDRLDEDRLKDVREELVEQIQIIQATLTYARDVEIKAGHPVN